jgi:hypothetical protein
MLHFRHDVIGDEFCDQTDLYAQNPWVSSLFVCPQVMIMDRSLYDHTTHNWTVAKYLADVDSRYGGLDCVLLWHSYTNLGADTRNQMDMLRTVPGGVAGLKKVVDQFHEQGVKVLFPWNPWDRNATWVSLFSFHRPVSQTHPQASREESDTNFVDLLLQTGADGFNLDSGGRPGVPGTPGYDPHSMVHGVDGSQFVKFALAERNATLLDQPEHASGCPPGAILGGWVGEGGGPTDCATGEFLKGGFPLECAKFVEPRHTSQFVQRFATERQPALRYAFFNGLGYVTWENCWGKCSC